jgi:predicted nucleic acid-binding protein
MKVLVDSNILIRWLEPNHPDQVLVARALDRLTVAKADLCYTSQNVGEFWNAATRPVNRNGYGLSPKEADLRAKSFEERLIFLPDSLAVHLEWRRLLVHYTVSGVQVHDARLVAAMHTHSVEGILTFNIRDFARYSTVQIFHPAQI